MAAAFAVPPSPSRLASSLDLSSRYPALRGPPRLYVPSDFSSSLRRATSSCSAAPASPARRLHRSGSVSTVRSREGRTPTTLSSVQEAVAAVTMSIPRSMAATQAANVRRSATAAARSRSNSVADVTGTGRNNFRPVHYQTHAELEAFFGVTTAPKRELRLRSHDTDGRIWFDPIEKEEWRHLLTPPSPRSPQSMHHGVPGSRRRSSAWSSSHVSTSSALGEAFPTSVTPTVASFSFSVNPRFGFCPPAKAVPRPHHDDAGVPGSGSEGPRRNRLKRANSATALARAVQPRLPCAEAGSWVVVADSKRRASGEDGAALRLPRLPLERRKATRELLDEAFTSTDTPEQPSPVRAVQRSHRPSPLTLAGARRPTSFHGDSPRSAAPKSARRRTSSTPSPPFQDLVHPSPLLALPSPTPTQQGRGRRNTFGAPVVDEPPRSAVSVLSPISSASSPRTMEVLASPLPAPQRDETEEASVLRRVPSNDAARSLRSVASDASLALSFTSTGTGTTGLMPRQAHRRHAPSLSPPLPIRSLTPATPVLGRPTSNGTLASVAPPQLQTHPLTQPPRERYKISAGLQTGIHVYDGVDIPCAAVHLASDDESSSCTDADDAGSRKNSSKGKKTKRVKKWLAKVVVG